MKLARIEPDGPPDLWRVVLVRTGDVLMAGITGQMAAVRWAESRALVPLFWHLRPLAQPQWEDR